MTTSGCPQGTANPCPDPVFTRDRGTLSLANASWCFRLLP